MTAQLPTEYEDHVRALLDAIRNGQRVAFDELIVAIRQDMQKLSAFFLRTRGRSSLMHTTALVHEAVLRLTRALNKNSEHFPQTKEHLMALIGQMMVWALTDYFRKDRNLPVPLDAPRSETDTPQSLADDVALKRWSQTDIDGLLVVKDALDTIERGDPKYGPRRRKVIELYLFSGMTHAEIAAELGVAEHVVQRDCAAVLTRLRALLRGANANRR
jgi:RNA polymerase sigma factor (sigma-70 family)